MKGLLLVILGLLLPLAWIFAIPGERQKPRARQQSLHQLQETTRLIEAWRDRNKAIPANLSDLRYGANLGKKRWKPYDAWGYRLDYLPLTDKFFTLRSFGLAYHGGSANPRMDRLPPLRKRAPAYRDPGKNLNLFPSSLLMGNRSPDDKRIAGLLIHPRTGRKTLLVRSSKNKKELKTAPHPGVEEFLWVDEGRLIVYTATGSDEHEDGIFYWDIKTGRTRNLISDLSQRFAINRGRQGGYFYLALSAFRKKEKAVYAFISSNRAYALNPVTFLSTQHLYRIGLPERFHGRIKIQSLKNQSAISTFSQPPIDPAGSISRDYNGTLAQNDWGQLQTAGSIQSVMESWQRWSMMHHRSPAFPYSLWWLGSLYADSWQTMKTQDPLVAESLRALGAEIMRKLVDQHTAPGYLRAMGAWTHSSLLNKSPSGYKVSVLTR